MSGPGAMGPGFQAPSPQADLDTRSKLIGVWALVSAEYRNEAGPGRAEHFTGEVVEYLGENPTGSLIYTANGFMSVQLMAQPRPEFHMNDRLSGTSEEVRRAFEGYHAYFGRYHVSGPCVYHHIIGCTFPNMIGTTQQRYFEFVEGRKASVLAEEAAAAKARAKAAEEEAAGGEGHGKAAQAALMGEDTPAATSGGEGGEKADAGEASNGHMAGDGAGSAPSAADAAGENSGGSKDADEASPLLGERPAGGGGEGAAAGAGGSAACVPPSAPPPASATWPPRPIVTDAMRTAGGPGISEPPFEDEPDELILRTSTVIMRGQPSVGVLIWQRVNGPLGPDEMFPGRSPLPPPGWFDEQANMSPLYRLLFLAAAIMVLIYAFLPAIREGRGVVGGGGGGSGGGQCRAP